MMRAETGRAPARRYQKNATENLFFNVKRKLPNNPEKVVKDLFIAILVNAAAIEAYRLQYARNYLTREENAKLQHNARNYGTMIREGEGDEGFPIVINAGLAERLNKYTKLIEMSNVDVFTRVMNYMLTRKFFEEGTFQLTEHGRQVLSNLKSTPVA